MVVLVVITAVVAFVVIVILRLREYRGEPSSGAPGDEPSGRAPGCVTGIVGVSLIVLGFVGVIWFDTRDCCWISPAAFGGGSCPTRDCEGWETRILGWSIILFIVGGLTGLVGLVIYNRRN